MTSTLPAADRAAAIGSLARFLAMCLPGKEPTVTVECPAKEPQWTKPMNTEQP